MAVRTARSRLHMIAPLKIALAVTLFQKIWSTLQSVPPPGPVAGRASVRVSSLGGGLQETVDGRLRKVA